jgi:hypothetical protein
MTFKNSKSKLFMAFSMDSPKKTSLEREIVVKKGQKYHVVTLVNPFPCVI